jgi:mannose-6-phosphate isomerase-like protein (cupin superfamily)
MRVEVAGIGNAPRQGMEQFDSIRSVCPCRAIPSLHPGLPADPTMPMTNDPLEEPIRSAYATIEPYVTRDGSLIRELMHPSVHGNRMQSLAEAIVPPGARTLLHRHRLTEETYHFTGGSGRMRLGDRVFDVVAGDTVCIPPGTAHNLENTGGADLRLLCACAPAYAHQDTELLAQIAPTLPVTGSTMPVM